MEDFELTDLRKQCMESLFLCTQNVAKYVEEGKVDELQKLKTHVEEYCLLEAQQDVSTEAFDRIKKDMEASRSESMDDIFTEYLNSLAQRNLNVDTHPYMVEFQTLCARSLNANRLSENLDESDLAITESQDHYLDPITKKPIEDPVKNTVCGHVYEREAIMALIKKKERSRCPVAGCGNRGPIVPAHLVTDEELKFRLAITQQSTMIQNRSFVNLDTTN